MNESKNNIKVSICCITYNHSKYIEETINGFLIQKTPFDFEIIISDDASTDGNQEIIKKYQNNFPQKIKFIAHKNNLGMMGNYVNTLKRCKGEYIAICEGDDYWIDPYKLQTQVDFLDKYQDYVLSYHNVIAQNINTSIKTKKVAKKILFKQPPENIPVGHKYHTSSMMFRNIIDNYPPQIFEVENTGDSFLQFLITRHGRVYFHRNIYPNIRRRNPESLYSYKDKETKIKYSILLYEKLLEIAENKKEKKYLNKNLMKRHSKYIIFLWNNGKKIQSISHLLKSYKDSLNKNVVIYFTAYLFFRKFLTPFGKYIKSTHLY